MKLNILVVGDHIKLLKDKEVTLINASQNKLFLEKYKNDNKNIKSIRKDETHINLKKGTVLKVDRVYIRKGEGADYNSLTFVSKNNNDIPDGRFFLSVDTVNELDVEVIRLTVGDNVQPIRKKIFERSLEIRREREIYLDSCRFEAFKEFFDFSQKPLYSCKLRLNLEAIFNESEKENIIKIYKKALEKNTLTPKDKISFKKFYDYLINEKQVFKSEKNHDLSSLDAEISLYKIKEDFVVKFNNNLFNDEVVMQKAVYLHNYNKFIKLLLLKGVIEKDSFKEKDFLKSIDFFIKNEFGQEFLKPNSGIINLEGNKGLIENSSDESEFFIFYDFIKYFAFFNPNYNDDKYISYCDGEDMIFDTKKLRSKLTRAKKIHK